MIIRLLSTSKVKYLTMQIRVEMRARCWMKTVPCPKSMQSDQRSTGVRGGFCHGDKMSGQRKTDCRDYWNLADALWEQLQTNGTRAVD